ncbi:lactadherin-like [Petromyzon marinus]|uniref:EGF-like repeat and discoidin I-like domain-containing protein 3 n=1 Tax=Petromyzon marinus TaxID=7757 RepID=A0AAJ7WJP6_PETMA|nr:EGF-like repeat and discoidin I-like domain-containing protein 3 [Petromyzon marinus]
MRAAHVGEWLVDCELVHTSSTSSTSSTTSSQGMSITYTVLDGQECGKPLGMQSGLITDNQLSASSYDGEEEWAPWKARLDLGGRVNAWTPSSFVDSWIQVDLLRVSAVSQVTTQGASRWLSKQFVTSVELASSGDGRSWRAYRAQDATGGPLLFIPANNDSSSHAHVALDPPIVARYLRIYPKGFINRPSLRLEVYGCDAQACGHKLGMASGEIRDDQITASSHKKGWFGRNWEAHQARLDNGGMVNAWQAKRNAVGEWLQVDFARLTTVTGVVSQGARERGTSKFVRSFTLLYSGDGAAWTAYRETSGHAHRVFVANRDNHTYARSVLAPPLLARYVRLYPQTWETAIVLRVEFLGCPYSAGP